MSIPALQELEGELRRLTTAGAELARGDFRLKRLIPMLGKSGESVPVFARAAELTGQLVSEEENERPARLLELANLVNAVLATQGKWGAEGDFVSFYGLDTCLPSFLPYCKLKSIEDALTRPSSGRMEVLREAQAEGAFRDFRLAAPLVAALSDSYAELNEFAAARLAEYGALIVPYLKKGFDPAGGKPHARRVEAISLAAGASENAWYRSVAEEAEGAVKAAAVYALRLCPENEDALLTHTFDRRKEVREAAFAALGPFGSEAVVKRFIDAFDGRDRDAAMAGIHGCTKDLLTEHIMRRADEALGSLVKSGKVYEAERKKTAVGYADTDAATLSDALEALRHKAHPDLLAFYASMERSAALLTWLLARPDTSFGTAARQWAWNVLHLGATRPNGSIDPSAGPKERFALLDGLLGRYGDYFVEYSFAAAVLSKPSKELFNRYAPVLKAGKSDAAGILREVFLCVLPCGDTPAERERYTSLKSVDMLRAAKPDWDKRWIGVFAKTGEKELVERMNIWEKSSHTE